MISLIEQVATLFTTGVSRIVGGLWIIDCTEQPSFKEENTLSMTSTLHWSLFFDFFVTFFVAFFTAKGLPAAAADRLAVALDLDLFTFAIDAHVGSKAFSMRMRVKVNKGREKEQDKVKGTTRERWGASCGCVLVWLYSSVLTHSAHCT